MPHEELKPKRTDSFAAGGALRPLAPFEEFEAMRLDLKEWFDLSRPGLYQVWVTFSAESGFGEGTSNRWYFTMGDADNPQP